MHNLVQTIITSVICIVLSVFLGYSLATPDTLETIGFIGLILTGLGLPLAFKWHYPTLLFSWNASMSVFFLPGQTQLWMLMAVVSLFFSIMAFTLNRNVPFQIVPSLSWALGILLAVVFLTAFLRTGIGLRSIGGGSAGGRYYFFILFAVCGYFALSCKKIASEQVARYLNFFLLGAVTTGFSNLIYFAGEQFYWLYIIFPLGNALTQISADISGSELVRFSGFAFASQWLFSWMLARYGVRGLMDVSKLWRVLLMVGIIILGVLGGFRSVLIFFALLFLIQFYLEGLLRSRYAFMLLAIFVLVFSIVIPFSSKMPLAVQRTLSILPVEIDPSVRMDAEFSTEWRLKMWSALVPEIQTYLFLGKGYSLNENDLYLVQEAQKRGLAQSFDVALLAGDYHSGPLSLLISFGILGLLAFIFFGVVAIRVLYRNYRYSEPALQKINTFLFAIFTTRFILFWAVYGALATDLPILAGLIGFSVAINGGTAKKAVLSKIASNVVSPVAQTTR